MKGLKLDFKKIGMETAGNAAGLVLVHQANKIPFVQKITKPVMKGLGTLLVGRIGLPWLAGMAGMGGKKGGAFVEGASHAMATYGIGQILSNVEATKSMVPAISGYEDAVYGMGLIEDEDSAVEGYEDAVYGVGASDDDADNVYE